MDLTVGSKMDKETGAPSTTSPEAEPIATDADAGPRNPATFVAPRTSGGGKISLDRDLIMKGGILVLGFLIVILLAIWMFTGRGNKPATTTVASSAEATWAKPLTGEAVLSLVASSAVSVTVTTKADGTILYKGTIPRGDRRDVPRRGELRVVADPYQNLIFEIGGKPYNMPAGAADIRAP